MNMSPKYLLWIIFPLALSAGVLWLSAQDRNQPEGIRMGELAEKLQEREKAVALREAALRQHEQRLNTLQATLAQEQERLSAKDKAMDDEKARFEAERRRELERIKGLEATLDADRIKELERMREEQTREIEKIREERTRLRTAATVDEQLIRTYEAMEPAQASRALQELAKTNFDIAVGLLAAMSPKKAARVMDQLVPLDTKLTGDLSERLGLIRKDEKK